MSARNRKRREHAERERVRSETATTADTREAIRKFGTPHPRNANVFILDDEARRHIDALHPGWSERVDKVSDSYRNLDWGGDR
jgi:hypothetical protein